MRRGQGLLERSTSPIGAQDKRVSVLLRPRIHARFPIRNTKALRRLAAKADAAAVATDLQVSSQSQAVNRALRSARDTASLASERYQKGLSSYLDVAEAQRASLQAERQETQLARSAGGFNHSACEGARARRARRPRPDEAEGPHGRRSAANPNGIFGFAIGGFSHAIGCRVGYHANTSSAACRWPAI
jgi:hypothetical protein